MTLFRLTAFLKRSPALGRRQFVNGLQDLSAQVLNHAAAKDTVRRAVLNLPYDPVPPEHVWIAADDFDAAAELWFDTVPQAVAVCNALQDDPQLRDAAAALIDQGASRSWIGQVTYDFEKPGATVKRMVAGQKADHLTLEDAQRYWLKAHNAFFKGFPAFMAYMLSYLQVTGIPTPELLLPSYEVFGMHADVGFASLQDLSDAYREPTHAAVMMTDILKFGATSGAITFTAAHEAVLFDNLTQQDREN